MTDEQEGLKQELRILAENLSNLIRETNDTKEILTNFITGLQDLNGEQTEFWEELWGGLKTFSISPVPTGKPIVMDEVVKTITRNLH